LPPLPFRLVSMTYAAGRCRAALTCSAYRRDPAVPTKFETLTAKPRTRDTPAESSRLAIVAGLLQLAWPASM
jgi:hypothetical protein